MERAHAYVMQPSILQAGLCRAYMPATFSLEVLPATQAHQISVIHLALVSVCPVLLRHRVQDRAPD